MVTVSGNPNPTNPTNSINPTTKYRCEFVNLNCIIPEHSSHDSTHPIYEQDLARNTAMFSLKHTTYRTINITRENVKHIQLKQMYYNS